MTTTFSDLISRVEKLTGPDRRIDAEIARIIDPAAFTIPECATIYDSVFTPAAQSTALTKARAIASLPDKRAATLRLALPLLELERDLYAGRNQPSIAVRFDTAIKAIRMHSGRMGSETLDDYLYRWRNWRNGRTVAI